jgi:hypothetical protein
MHKRPSTITPLPFFNHFSANSDCLSHASTSIYRTEIQYVDNAVFGSSVSMFEIKFPDNDIKIRVA